MSIFVTKLPLLLIFLLHVSSFQINLPLASSGRNAAMRKFAVIRMSSTPIVSTAMTRRKITDAMVLSALAYFVQVRVKSCSAEVQNDPEITAKVL